mmetsp:Transcript_121525/g.221034  ORF Transcript_121525/g.221034 Transcript_121525/m.221034 type:complete len:341 (-) Transcript_121525:1108-2130(-)
MVGSTDASIQCLVGPMQTNNGLDRWQHGWTQVVLQVLASRRTLPVRFPVTAALCLARSPRDRPRAAGHAVARMVVSPAGPSLYTLLFPCVAAQLVCHRQKRPRHRHKQGSRTHILHAPCRCILSTALSLRRSTTWGRPRIWERSLLAQRAMGRLPRKCLTVTPGRLCAALCRQRPLGTHPLLVRPLVLEARQACLGIWLADLALSTVLQALGTALQTTLATRAPGPARQLAAEAPVEAAVAQCLVQQVMVPTAAALATDRDLHRIALPPAMHLVSLGRVGVYHRAHQGLLVAFHQFLCHMITCTISMVAAGRNPDHNLDEHRPKHRSRLHRCRHTRRIQA